jgi:hypothetical protein
MFRESDGTTAPDGATLAENCVFQIPGIGFSVPTKTGTVGEKRQ